MFELIMSIEEVTLEVAMQEANKQFIDAYRKATNTNPYIVTLELQGVTYAYSDYGAEIERKFTIKGWG